MEQIRLWEQQFGNTMIKTTICLEATEDILIERLQSRGREDDTEEAIKERLKVFGDETRPVLWHFAAEMAYVVSFYEIDANESIEKVYDKIKAIIIEQESDG